MKPRVKFNRHLRHWQVLWKGECVFRATAYAKALKAAIHICNFHHRIIRAN
jgi:hypothetical protein